MFLDGTGTVVNEDWTWAEAWADLGLRPTLDDLGLRLGPILMSSVETRQMSQQQPSVLSQQKTSVLSQQKVSNIDIWAWGAFKTVHGTILKFRGGL